MAFNDTLFQLGMDLTRSSTAQKEDYSRAAFNVEVQDRNPSPSTERSICTAGTTIYIDLHGAKRLDDVKSAERATKRAVESLGRKLKSLHLDRVAGGGVSGVAVLDSGQISLQACSRSGFAAVDARGCSGLKPEVALLVLADAFGAREAVIQRKRALSDVELPALRVVPKAPRRAQRQKAQAKAA
ncbi:S-adenosylmethionine decarboxylase [Hyphomicrobium methylovorum]|uniref:S-adenosylmethionine decarboxylase family protein n=1 Tax=Hyphomicrobium methylovorum TaxID=84 RepID=UPI0015E73ED8|nr:S-adenosylmethionine decarboxylase [Hyphomicrobium methylovorum]MBA2125728.1 S-adenosylmethionine decarboxylase [Hyphomicrobium methylovorum]